MRKTPRTEGCIEGSQEKEDENQVPSTMAEMWRERTRVGKYDTEGVGRVRAGKDGAIVFVLCLIVKALGSPWRIINRGQD